MPKIPRNPTDHQLSDKASLIASQRAFFAAALIFPDAVLAAMDNLLRSARLIGAYRQTPLSESIRRQ
jgi:hypothetical protein